MTENDNLVQRIEELINENKTINRQLTDFSKTLKMSNLE